MATEAWNCCMIIVYVGDQSSREFESTFLIDNECDRFPQGFEKV